MCDRASCTSPRPHDHLPSFRSYADDSFLTGRPASGLCFFSPARSSSLALIKQQQKKLMTSLSWLKLCSDILSRRKIAELLDRTREACRRLVLWSPRSHQLPSSHLKAPGSGNSEPPVGPPTALPWTALRSHSTVPFQSLSPKSPFPGVS